MKPRMTTKKHRRGADILHTLCAKFAGHRIVSALRPQFGRHIPIVSALRRQSSNRLIFYAVRSSTV